MENARLNHGGYHQKKITLHMLHVLYVISGNQSSVAKIFVFAFIVSAFLHVPLKQLVLAIALCRTVAQVAQSCDTGCGDRE